MSQDLFDEGMIDGGAPFPDASGNAIREIMPCLGHDQKAVLVGTVLLLARKLERIRSVLSVLIFQTHGGYIPDFSCTHSPHPQTQP
jgi:hypothetical protein